MVQIFGNKIHCT